LRVTTLCGARPSKVTESIRQGAALIFPPTNAAPQAPAARTKPSKNVSRSSTSHSCGTPRLSKAKVGSPPIAAISLAFTVKAFSPRMENEVHSRRKCTFSIIASVVRRVVPERDRAAQSSPRPSRTRGSAGTRPRRRRKKGNSPRSLNFILTASLAKEFFNFFKEPLAHRVYVCAIESGKFFEQRPLFGTELTWGFNHDAHQLVPAAIPSQADNAFAAQAKDLTRLGSGRYLHLDLAFE